MLIVDRKRALCLGLEETLERDYCRQVNPRMHPRDENPKRCKASRYSEKLQRREKIDWSKDDKINSFI
jgi:hypothetical protein